LRPYDAAPNAGVGAGAANAALIGYITITIKLLDNNLDVKSVTPPITGSRTSAAQITIA
jgi:hypothetical protein